MKKFKVNVTHTYVEEVEVLAESMSDALDKAETVPFCPTGMEFSHEVGGIVDISNEDIDLPSLIAQAESIAQEALNDGEAIEVDEWPLIRTQAWDGNGMLNELSIVSSVYLDEAVFELCVCIENSGAEYYLSELLDIEQYEIAMAIIASKRK